MLSDVQREKRLGGERFRLAGNFAIINPKCVWDAILEEQPYPVKMLFFISSNPVLTRANAREVYRALEAIVGPDFITEDRAVIETYSKCSVDCPGFLKKHARDPSNIPACVVLPATTEEVQAICRVASRYGVRLNPFTNGQFFLAAQTTGDPTICVHVSRMNWVTIDEDTMSARLGAYADYGQLQAEAMKQSQAVGAAFLYLRWREDFPTEGEALFSSVFHSVSAFCNAGFTLFSTGLMPYRGDLTVNLTITTLIILGGLGFTTLSGFLNADPIRRGWRPYLTRMPTHTKLALVTTFSLLVAGTLYIFFFEFDGTLAPLGMKDKLLASYFQSVTLRTAGFNTVDVASFQNVTIWLMMIWMFVGGCPSSTAGGIKATTAAILVLAVRAMLLGREDVEIFGRSISKSVVYKSIAVVIISLLLVTVCFSLLLVGQAGSFVGLLFESVSAFANVGLTLGVTPTLGVAGKIIVIFLMYAGRIGPLTLALAVGEHAYRASFRYPEARILVG